MTTGYCRCSSEETEGLWLIDWQKKTKQLSEVKRSKGKSSEGSKPIRGIHGNSRHPPALEGYKKGWNLR